MLDSTCPVYHEQHHTLHSSSNSTFSHSIPASHVPPSTPQSDSAQLTQIAEWVKGLLAVPFVLYSQPTGVFGDGPSVTQMAEEAHRRYAEIMRDVELMIDDHSKPPYSPS
jgi:hypothetical protein